MAHPENNCDKSNAECSSTAEYEGLSRNAHTVAFLENKILNLEKDLRKRNLKLKNMKLLAIILATPYILVSLPISIPILIAYAVKKYRSKTQQKDADVAIEAVRILATSGLEEAVTYTRNKNKKHSSQILPILYSMNATTDETWLKHVNDFMSKNDCPTISLVSSSEPRFSRIEFEKPHHSSLSMDGPKITVIMPVYNAEKTLHLSIRSLLDQTWRNIEVIAVDDCSSDQSLHILEKIAKTDNRLIVKRQPANAGPYVAKNIALEMATGDFITGHDSDDIALPNRLENQIKPLLSNPKLGGSIGYWIRLNEQGVFTWPSKIGHLSFDGIHRLAAISLMLRREVFDQLGYWDTARFGADTEMISRVKDLLGKGLVYVKKLTILSLDDAGNLTSHPMHGISKEFGMSPIRMEYSNGWTEWHRSTSPEKRYLPFPHHGNNRCFPVPDEMIVSDEAIDTIIASSKSNASPCDHK